MKILNEKTEKPWGKFIDLADEPGKWHLKIIEVNEGERLSLQRHNHRSEFWVVAEGDVEAVKGDELHILDTKQFISIGEHEIHRLTALTKAVVVEITFGNHDENDIERLEDDYGRIK